MIANLHNKRPDRPIPNVPRLFHTNNASSNAVVDNIDILGLPFTTASYRPPFTPGLLNAACDLSIIQHGIIDYNFDVQEHGIDDDTSIRKHRYQSLQDSRNALPKHLRNEENSTPGTVFLR